MPLQQLSVSAVLPIAGNLRQIAGEALQAAGGCFDGLLKLSEAIAAPLLETDETAAFETCAEELAEVRGARRVQRAAAEEMNPTHVGIGREQEQDGPPAFVNLQGDHLFGRLENLLNRPPKNGRS